jgi:hypothetical protein
VARVPIARERNAKARNRPLTVPEAPRSMA